jgi:hypothetical protein
MHEGDAPRMTSFGTPEIRFFWFPKTPRLAWRRRERRQRSSRNQCAIANNGRRVDAIQQLARLVGVQHGRLAVLTTCFGSRTACAGLVATTWPVSSGCRNRVRNVGANHDSLSEPGAYGTL